MNCMLTLSIPRYMPPRWVLGQLPFDRAWLYMSEIDVNGLNPDRRACLEAEGALVLVS